MYGNPHARAHAHHKQWQISNVKGGKNKKKKDKKKNKNKGGRPQLEISGPTNFQHVGHVGWDSQNGFDTANLPPELRNIFQRAGITQDQMQNPGPCGFGGGGLGVGWKLVGWRPVDSVFRLLSVVWSS